MTDLASPPQQRVRTPRREHLGSHWSKSARALTLFAIAITALVSLTPIATAKRSRDGLVVLQNEMSRAQLFERIRRATVPTGRSSRRFNFPRQFVFPRNADYDAGKPRVNSFFGIDLSHHNSSGIAWERLRERKILFVYVKATQGTRYKDGKFAEYYSALARLPQHQRVLKGAYHFLSYNADGRAQAETFVRFVNQHGGFPLADLPPVMDLEWDVARANGPDRWALRNNTQIVDRAIAFLTRVEELTGRKPMIYTAVAWWNERKIPLAEFERLKPYGLWIADYSRSSRAIEDPNSFSSKKFDLWQFTERAKIGAGHSGHVDASVFKGTSPEFERSLGVALPQTNGLPH